MNVSIPTVTCYPVTPIKNVLVNTDSGKKRVRQIVSVDFVEYVQLQNPIIRHMALYDLSGVSVVHCKQTGVWYLSENGNKGKAILYKPKNRP